MNDHAVKDEEYCVIVASCVPLISDVVVTVMSNCKTFFNMSDEKQRNYICGLEHCFVSVSLQTSLACILVSVWSTKDDIWINLHLLIMVTIECPNSFLSDTLIHFLLNLLEFCFVTTLVTADLIL